MLKEGYPEPFCDQITQNLNTDFTAQRMIGYLFYNKNMTLEVVADEMLAILSDCNSIIKKKEMETTNKSWNQFLNNGFNEQ